MIMFSWKRWGINRILQCKSIRVITGDSVLFYVDPYELHVLIRRPWFGQS